ncbi:MAG TPA: methylated-DNA--[protein]-cysteine S-methyltransferase [Burkholderiales bacterium]|nr:methylated-DNA--[protein]-cysteine S-methyltransferase [Burkholderiales bacterium]
MTVYTWYESPLGRMLLTAKDDALTGVHFADEKYYPGVDPGWRHDLDALVLRRAAKQLDEYFAGRRRRFDLPLAPQGTPFQRKVWQALTGIGYGTTISYGELACRVGDPGASRAVGAANGRNPISIMVPCHRVIGANGDLTGYAGGLQRKKALLALESAEAQPSLFAARTG